MDFRGPSAPPCRGPVWDRYGTGMGPVWDRYGQNASIGAVIERPIDQSDDHGRREYARTGHVDHLRFERVIRDGQILALQDISLR